MGNNSQPSSTSSVLKFILFALLMLGASSCSLSETMLIQTDMVFPIIENVALSETGMDVWDDEVISETSKSGRSENRKPERYEPFEPVRSESFELVKWEPSKRPKPELYELLKLESVVKSGTPKLITPKMPKRFRPADSHLQLPVADLLPTDILPADILPTDVLPTDVLPADVLPADVLPTDVLPVDVDVLPADPLEEETNWGDVTDEPFYAKYSKILGINLDGTENKGLLRAIVDWLGTPFKWGGCSKKGVDCSCFVQSIYEEVYGIKISRTSRSIFRNDLNSVGKQKLEEGDILSFKMEGDVISHIGIYLKENKFAHVSRKKGVKLNHVTQPYYRKRFFSAGRVKNRPDYYIAKNATSEEAAEPAALSGNVKLNRPPELAEPSGNVKLNMPPELAPSGNVKLNTLVIQDSVDRTDTRVSKLLCPTEIQRLFS